MRQAPDVQHEKSASTVPSPEELTAHTRRHDDEIHQSTHALRADEIAEYSALTARATNDALRDWDVISGRLVWPQGLENLLGHSVAATPQTIGFWQKHVHPEDRARTAASIRDALAQSENWNGEYRFRRADGVYVLVLERACILRNERA
ncbi:MAG: PAS domain-containing protein, partial [Verrucomicrobiota bacterium]|nr:PAS domain-containing protein [Verrucomicrobiota bacterium]